MDPWREAGPINHLGDEVDPDQFVGNKKYLYAGLPETPSTYIYIYIYMYIYLSIYLYEYIYIYIYIYIPL